MSKTDTFKPVEFAARVRDNLTRWINDEMGTTTFLGGIIGNASTTLLREYGNYADEWGRVHKLPTRDEIAEAIEGGIFDRPTALTWRGDAESGEHWIESPIREVADQGADAVLELLKGEGRG